MRVISGKLGSRPLKSPKGAATRPVLDQVKEAIFNILPSPEGVTVLDLFAGTGALGIEALSRGGTEAVFVESDPACSKILLQNLFDLGIADVAYVIAKPAAIACRLLRKKERHFDWIFCDPPYDRNLLALTLHSPDLLALTRPDTILIVEHSPREPFPENGLWTVHDRRHYGQTVITFARRA